MPCTFVLTWRRSSSYRPFRRRSRLRQLPPQCRARLTMPASSFKLAAATSAATACCLAATPLFAQWRPARTPDSGKPWGPIFVKGTSCCSPYSLPFTECFESLLEHMSSGFCSCRGVKQGRFARLANILLVDHHGRVPVSVALHLWYGGRFGPMGRVPAAARSFIQRAGAVRHRLSAPPLTSLRGGAHRTARCEVPSSGLVQIILLWISEGAYGCDDYKNGSHEATILGGSSHPATQQRRLGC